MKKHLTYLLIISYIFFTGNISVFFWDSTNIQKINAATTGVSYAWTAIDLLDSSMSWITPFNATWDTTLTSAISILTDRNVNSNTLALTNFDLSSAWLPNDAVITGIQVDIEWNGDNQRVQDSLVQLTKDWSNGVWSNLANNANGPTTKTIQSYWSSTELWGTSWTAAELLSSNFWVLLQYTNRRNNDFNVYVYRAIITVSYNSVPTDITLSSQNIDEGLPIGTTIGNMTTIDADVSDTHTYSFSCDTPWVDDASFSITGSNLNSAEVFNFAVKSSYEICIRTDDGNGGMYDKNFTISINEIIATWPWWVLTNLQIWLKADAGTSTAIDGTPLASWADQSGNGYDATAVVNPTYYNSTQQLNFNPLIDFDGATQYMQNLTNGAYSDSYFMVLVPDNDIDGTISWQVPFWLDCESGILSSGTCGLPFGWMVLWSFTIAIPDEVLTHAIGASTGWRSAETGTSSYPASKPMLVVSNENASTDGTEIYEKGVQLNNFSFNTYQQLWAADYSLWRSLDGANPFFYDGKIAEVINYSGRIEPAERNKIESYLALKYGITLSSGTQDYTASDGSTIFWSPATAGTFTNNIFGIGRDDVSQLGQVMSKSVNNDAIIRIEAVGEWTNLNPSFNDITDKEFLSISHEGWSNAWTSVDAPALYNILTRKWKSQEIWDTGALNITFDVGDSDFDVPPLNAWTVYNFIYDSNSNGSLSDETPLPMINTAWNEWQISSVNLIHNQIFSIATQASLNNIPTDIVLSNNNVDENVANGTTVWTLSTTDIDIGDTHSYSFVAGIGDDNNGNFTISGSTISINNSPDYELKNSYTVRIETNDGNGGTYQKSFDIFINNLWEAITTIIDLEDISDESKYTVTSGTWSRTLTNPQEWIYSLESDNGGINNTQSCFEIQHTFTATWTIDFQYSVSSEATSDFLRFYIDEVEQGTGWSWDIPYTPYTSIDIAPGTHDYKWCYMKDGGWSAGTDNAYIDYIYFPNTSWDVTPPTISAINYASGSLLPGGNHNIVITYSDSESGINTGSDVMQLYKWNGTAWGADISATWLNLWWKTITSTSASYPTSNLSYGKYLYAFQISDNDGNSSSTGAVFYIDEPELIVSTGSIDIGNINNLIESFSDTVTITVRTVGAPFTITLDRTSPFTEGIENIPSWDGIEWYGYESEPFVNTISPINTGEIIGSEIQNINMDGLKNTYTYNIKMWALTSEGQVSWDYIWDLEFGIDLTY